MGQLQAKEIIKQARERKGLTQQQVADLLHIGIRNYQHIEGGRFPKFKTQSVKDLERILEIEVYDKLYDENTISIVHELGKHLETDGVTVIDTQAEVKDYLKKRRDIKAVHNPYLVPFVSTRVQAGYVKALDAVEYVSSLEKYSMPPGVDPLGAEWLYFEIDGDSMEDTFKKGDIILTSRVPQIDFFDIKDFYVYVVVTADQLMIKRLFKKSAESWVLISDNEELYPQQLIHVDAIRQLWLYRKTWHTNAKPPKKFEIKV